ncbi:hypothetical protein [Halalkalibacter nanhaiisediminis]|nr:hypothetical protein [Halalkalibacter nanhaiisediminis]
METIKASFDDQKKIQLFLEEVEKRYPRYMRDQLQILSRAVKNFEPFTEFALEICIKQTLWSANDFHDVVRHLARTQEQESIIPSTDMPIVEMSSTYYK